ncbi:AraC family transcriptional regulator with amidase-like domain [Roseivirga ehrenbergii]|uniref:AraC family transcriptional regulator n=1 Tax=Roseivirga ehrenbergii (strain DSM 102268 / JCM 13514 / KCTC 12282 / NCIMB 14502 / KMM 6017) TaxID=279360 RepID=A0A150X0A1_ROSEK|nr:helix-turn-helix domain-containing protein [Roseivirga ehrenbergii]KYG72170.1 AraC family transcriptional regulator [Roseivirga ehrenbergii]TCL13405.1 AraC family transcriptional regulator with amidase-like domain [Roseivirga ehrenbergii]
MKTVSIFVPESSVMEAVADPRYMFTAANQFLQAAGKTPLFNVQLVALTKEVRLHGGVFSVHADKLISEVKQTDLIIIPALFGDMKTAVEVNQEAIPWIIEQHNKGAEVASLCVGAFLLASTGLLKDKKCSTHWAYYNEFRETFPDVEIMDGSIITEEKGIYSSGGANSYWNLLLYILEKYTDRDTAILASKYFAIDIDRSSQSSFAIFNGQKDHNDEAVKLAQQYLEAHFQERISVDEVANHVAVSRRSFERRFKQSTGNTVLEYLQRIKIEAAKRSFESSRKNINEVMFDVGYTDTKAFRNVFKKITGLTPIEYRNKYAKVEVAV